MTQMSVRLPVELRDAAHAVATQHGVTLTHLVEQALKAEIARRTDPAAQFSAQVADAVRRRIVAALDDGTWDEAVSAYTADDPDLAS